MMAKLMTRCQWCKKRIGYVRYYIGNKWARDIIYEAQEVHFTDGICPECRADLLKKHEEGLDFDAIDRDTLQKHLAENRKERSGKVTSAEQMLGGFTSPKNGKE